MFITILPVFLWKDSYMNNQQFCFCLMVITTCCSCTAVMYLYVVSLLLIVSTLILNPYAFVFLLPLRPVPCREEVLNIICWLKDLVNIKRLRFKLTYCMEKNLLATVTRPMSYPNPCFKNPWAQMSRTNVWTPRGESCWGGSCGWDQLGDWDWHIYTNMYKIDK